AAFARLIGAQVAAGAKQRFADDIVGECVGTVTLADCERARPWVMGFFRKLLDRPLGGAS
ncbi:hypothetical protein ABZU45_41860, partial [Streptomyces avermitilis]